MARDSVRNPIIVGDKVQVLYFNEERELKLSDVYIIVKIAGKRVDLINNENKQITMPTSRIKRI